MKNTSKTTLLKLLILPCALLMLFLFSCGQNESPEQLEDRSEVYLERDFRNQKFGYYDSNADSNPGLATEKSQNISIHDANGNATSSSAATVHKDTNRKFIRTADLKLRVKDVRQATFSIEDIVSDFDGFVTYTKLTSNIDRKTNVRISADSSLETLYYTVRNNITIRIPNTQLDTTLKQIAHHIDYLDHRIIVADDVTLKFLANKLDRKRMTTHGKRLAKGIDNTGKKLKNIVQAEEALADKQEELDATKLANLKMRDQMEYSTIRLYLYQRQATKRDMVANDSNIDAYEPGFMVKAKESLITGWRMLEFILLFLLKIWVLLALGIISIGIRYRFFK